MERQRAGRWPNLISCSAQVLKRAGVEGRPMLLFLEDYQLLDPAFLEYVNSLLSGGEGGGAGVNNVEDYRGWF